MKVTVVPAQVTTVEDRIIGTLGFTQMILLVVPVFTGAALFAVLPPAMEASTYKYMLMGLIAFMCCSLAVRIKGNVLLFWLLSILRYNVRPRFYVFDKNVINLREQYEDSSAKGQKDSLTSRDKVTAYHPRLGVSESIEVYNAISNPASNLRFEATRKGGLNVRIAEVKK